MVNDQSLLHCWKGSLLSRHVPCSCAAHTVIKIWGLCLQLRVVKIFHKNTRKKNRTVEAAHLGLVNMLVGSTTPWQRSCLASTYSDSIRSVCHSCTGGSWSAWQHLPCSVLPVWILTDPIFLSSTMRYGSVLLWTSLCEQWSMVQSLPSQQNLSKFWSRKQYLCTRKLQTSSSVLISPASETC